MGIEPTSEAWEASILPLYDARSVSKLTQELARSKLALCDSVVAETCNKVVVD